MHPRATKQAAPRSRVLMPFGMCVCCSQRQAITQTLLCVYTPVSGSLTFSSIFPSASPAAGRYADAARALPGQHTERTREKERARGRGRARAVDVSRSSKGARVWISALAPPAPRMSLSKHQALIHNIRYSGLQD